MLKLQLNSGRWDISFGSGISLSHSKEKPFASIVYRETVSVTERKRTFNKIIESKRIPLSDIKTAGLDTLIFSGDGHKLTIRFRENQYGVELAFSGEESLPYEFSIPAFEGEAVFGGGLHERLKLGSCELYDAENKIIPIFTTDRCRLIMFGTAGESYASFGPDAYLFGFDSCPRGAVILKGDSYAGLCGFMNTLMPYREFAAARSSDAYSLKDCFSLAFSGVSTAEIKEPELYSSILKSRKRSELIHRVEISCFSLNNDIYIPSAAAEDKKLKEYISKLSDIHCRLLPYLQHCREKAAAGIPQIRPDFWESTAYTSSHDAYSYFLGDDLFVSPDVEKGSRKKLVYLPAGTWVLLWTGEEYEGPAPYTIEAPLGSCPVFYRKGSEYEELFKGFSIGSAQT